MQKKLMYLEIAGILFIVIMSVFMQNLLDLSGPTYIFHDFAASPTEDK